MIKRTPVLLGMILIATVPALSYVPRLDSQSSTNTTKSSKRTSSSINIDDNNWRWRHTDNDARLDVNIRGHVEFADDYSDVTSISDGGSILVIDESGGMNRKFEAVASGGAIQRSYWVNGRSHPIDSEARSWLARILDATVRAGGYDARVRVQKILRQSGPAGVLQEISQLKSDYVKRVYFDELLQSGKLDDRTVGQVLQHAANEVNSDYEKAQLLIKLSESYVENDAQRAIYLQGVNTIHSDYEKGRALGALLKKGNLSRENLLFAIRSTANVSSEYERAQLLI